MGKKEAASRLHITPRHLRRIYKRYLVEGVNGLTHRRLGKPSSRRRNSEEKEKILCRYREKYMGFGPTFASEKLEELDGLKVHPETLRLWLLEANLWEKRKKSRKHRRRKKRKEKFGEMLQLDGSIHQWLWNSDKKSCLMNLVDDATGKTMSFMDKGETTFAAFTLLRHWIQEHGIPQSIYVDLKSLYVSPKSLKEQEDTGIEAAWLTHFSKSCKKLNIGIIKAYSAQAKGRVERNHRVYQDRLVKDLKLMEAQTIEDVNKFLKEKFINSLNEKFMQEAVCSQDGHLPLDSKIDLDEILCWEDTRTVSNDCTIRFENRYYQLEKASFFTPAPKMTITVRRRLDGSLSFNYKETKLKVTCLSEKTQKVIEKKKSHYTSADRSRIARENKSKTPWGRDNAGCLKNVGQSVCFLFNLIYNPYS